MRTFTLRVSIFVDKTVIFPVSSLELDTSGTIYLQNLQVHSAGPGDRNFLGAYYLFTFTAASSISLPHSAVIRLA